MSKDFAMLIAARRLENYLSREQYSLKNMAENHRVSNELYEKKVSNYNELIATLNDLFSALAETPSSELFSPYTYGERNIETSDTVVVETKPVEKATQKEIEAVSSETETIKDDEPRETVKEDDEGEGIPEWMAEGYTSKDAWLQDMNIASTHTPDDLTLGVNDGLSQHHADQALEEYNKTKTRDVAEYLPEDDAPVEVLARSVTENITDEDESTSIEDARGVIPDNYDYMHRTVDNVQVDSDPTQIAAVETAVERYGEDGRKGADINASQFINQSKGSLADELIGEDFDRLMAGKE